MVFGQRAHPGQLPEADRVFQVLVDVLHQQPALVRGQSAFQAQPFAGADLAEQGVAEHFMGQAAGQQAFGGFVPVQRNKLMEATRLAGVFQERAFAQLQRARFAVQQGDAAEGELLRAEIHVGQADFAVDHPGGLMFGWQDAQLVGPALGARLVTPKRAGATADVARQRVMARRLVVLGIVMVAPQGRRQAVTELGAGLQACVGRAVKGLKDLQGFQIRHGEYSLTPCILLRAAIAVIPPPDKSARLCKRLARVQGNTVAQSMELAMNLSLYLLTVLIWGTTWIALKWQLGVVAIPVSIVYRFGLAALVLFALLLVSRKLQVMNRRGHLICLAQGLCLFCVNFMCFLTASQWIPSGLVAVVFSTATLWNALNARVFFGQRVARNVLMGGGLGLAGLGLLFWPELVGHTASPQTLLGLGLALLGTMCFSAGNMLSSLQQKAGLKPLTTNAWGMAYGSAMLATYCAVRGIPFEMDWSARYIGALWYLVIPGSVIGFTAYLTLVGRMGPERAAYCTVLFPVVALNVSAFAEGYQWTAPALAGLVLVMLGNVLVFRKPKPAQLANPVFKAKQI